MQLHHDFPAPPLSQPKDAEHPLGLLQNLNPRHLAHSVLGGRCGCGPLAPPSGGGRGKDLTEVLGSEERPFVSFGSCCWVSQRSSREAEHRELGSIREGGGSVEAADPHKASTGMGIASRIMCGFSPAPQMPGTMPSQWPQRSSSQAPTEAWISLLRFSSTTAVRHMTQTETANTALDVGKAPTAPGSVLLKHTSWADFVSLNSTTKSRCIAGFVCHGQWSRPGTKFPSKQRGAGSGERWSLFGRSCEAPRSHLARLFFSMWPPLRIVRWWQNGASTDLDRVGFLSKLRVSRYRYTLKPD